LNGGAKGSNCQVMSLPSAPERGNGDLAEAIAFVIRW
jgi:hypothetical protein